MNIEFPIELKPDTVKKAQNLEINPEDIDEQFVRGSGKGGQKINKTSSAVRLRHIPTGIEVKCQRHREQNRNRLSAYKLLINKIEEIVKGEESEKAKKIHKIRKQKQRRSKKAKEKLLELKKKRSEIKETRKKVIR
ncbi:peptide chain release factor family protein [Patescibacteria group bacterium]